MRKRGISTIISCQNEEHLIAASILSFLRFSDEVIVVDNGSTDRTKEIAQEVAQAFPDTIRFFDAPHAKDLYENRQYGLERSHYQWIVRADSDYVCYTSGEFDCIHLRNRLLARYTPPFPIVYTLPHPNLRGDFLHTLRNNRPKGRREVIGGGDARIYRWYAGMKFIRLKRWEGANLPGRFKRTHHLENPIWIHCDVKSEINYFFRSERTNWREVGDFVKYPTLESFIRLKVLEEYGVRDIEEAAKINLQKDVLSYIDQYKPDKHMPYPLFVQYMIDQEAGYIIEKGSGGEYRRTYNGPPDTSALIELTRGLVR